MDWRGAGGDEGLGLSASLLTGGTAGLQILPVSYVPCPTFKVLCVIIISLDPIILLND